MGRAEENAAGTTSRRRALQRRRGSRCVHVRRRRPRRRRRRARAAAARGRRGGRAGRPGRARRVRGRRAPPRRLRGLLAATVLAAAAERTSRIRLTSAVSVLSSDDPVRVFQQFATLDLLSGGRAEIMAGRGSSPSPSRSSATTWPTTTPCSPRSSTCCSPSARRSASRWSGAHRAALVDQPVYPRPVQDPLPVWVAVGGNPQSVVRAGLLGAPARAGDHRRPAGRFAPLADLHRGALAEAGPRAGADEPERARLRGRHPGKAADVYYPAHSGVMNRIGRERGWGPTNRAAFDAQMRACAAPTPSATPRRWPRRSSSGTRCSARTARWSRWRSATCRTARCCARSSCSAPKWRALRTCRAGRRRSPARRVTHGATGWPGRPSPTEPPPFAAPGRGRSRCQVQFLPRMACLPSRRSTSDGGLRPVLAAHGGPPPRSSAGTLRSYLITVGSIRQGVVTGPGST